MSQGRIDGTQPVTMVVSLWDEVEVISRAFTDAWTSEVRTAVRIWGTGSGPLGPPGRGRRHLDWQSVIQIG